MTTKAVCTLSISIMILFSLQAMHHNEQQTVPASAKERPLQDELIVPVSSHANEHSNFLSQLNQEIFEHNIALQENTQEYRNRGTQLHHYPYHDARYLQILNELAHKINPHYLSNPEKQLLEKIYEILSRATFNHLLKLMSDPL